MSGSILAFKMAILSGGEAAIQYKDESVAKVAFPHLVKEMENYVNSKDYLMRMKKESALKLAKAQLDKHLQFFTIEKKSKSD